ncbi:hypothetical protein IT407_00830 [Candidatus Uhrbacteria bacterium]|nr:hypothetical protein [Candidatus Uhrbacteria bacterium]
MKLPLWSRWLAIFIAWSVVIGLGALIVSQRFPPNGIAQFSFVFEGKSPWFNPFEPGERVTSPGLQPEGWTGQRIIAEPVYGSARLPGAYDQLDISFETRSIRQPLAELGLLRDEANFNFEMHPLWSEALSRGWRPVSLGSARGFVREGFADSELLSQDFSKLMVWYATATEPALSDRPIAEKTYEISLRGSHDFHVVPVDNSIRFRFVVQDVNRNKEGKNTAAFRLMHGDELIWTEAVNLSGIADNRPSADVEKTIRIDNLKPGIYRLSFIADDDFFIREIRTEHPRWVIGPRIFFGDNVGWKPDIIPAIAWTNSIHAVAETFHKEGVQDVTLGQTTVRVGKTHTPFVLSRRGTDRSGFARLEAPAGTIRFIGDGYFSLDPDINFLPYPRRLTADADPANEGITAVLTPYQQPTDLGDGWWRVTTSYSLFDTRELKFVLGLPGMISRAGAFDIRYASLEYRRPPLSWPAFFETMKREARSAIQRLWP